MYMDRIVTRETKTKNALFILGMTTITALKFLQYNHAIPFSEFRQWKKWYIDSLFHYGR
jgi:hypothetical protein